MLTAATAGAVGCSRGLASGPTSVLTFADPRPAARIRSVDAHVEVSRGHRVNTGLPAARVDFAPVENPQFVIVAAESVWDWSGAVALMVPVENGEREPVALTIQVEEHDEAGGPGRALTWQAHLPADAVTTLVLPFAPLRPLAMGMDFEPPIGALPPGATVIRHVEGVVDRRQIASIRLTVPHPTAPRRLVFGDPGLIAGSLNEHDAYHGIVDGFGQYTRQTWPGKAESAADLEARWADEREQLDRWVAELPPRDRFGGIVVGTPLRASGFFRTELMDGRWWLVTPEGHRFFSVGISAIRPGVGATYVEGREFMFTGLPGPTDSLSKHYGEGDSRLVRAGAGLPELAGRGFDRGRWFNFYTANLERRHGPGWLEAWRSMTLLRLRAWGFNTIGNWSESELWDRREIPYVVPLSSTGDFARVTIGRNWGQGVPDPFDPGFAAAVEAVAARSAGPRRNDPFLIGYFVDNELAWSPGLSLEPRSRYGLAYAVLARGPDSPAKSAFVKRLAAKYREPARLASAWGIRLESWADLESSTFQTPLPNASYPEIATDLGELTSMFAAAYFRTVAKVLKRHDPNHLYLGSRFWTRTPEVVAACERHCDVVSFNVYARGLDGEEWLRFARRGKPAIIGEFHFGSTDRGMFAHGIVDVRAEAERGPAYARYLRSVLANAAFVGCHWFQYVDMPLVGRLLDGGNHHIGFVSVTDLPYRELVTAARQANLELLISAAAGRAVPARH